MDRILQRLEAMEGLLTDADNIKIWGLSLRENGAARDQRCREQCKCAYLGEAGRFHSYAPCCEWIRGTMSALGPVITHCVRTREKPSFVERLVRVLAQRGADGERKEYAQRRRSRKRARYIVPLRETDRSSEKI